MVLTCTSIQYPIKITSTLIIWTTNCLILTMDAELMGGNRRTIEGHNSLCLWDFPKENLILMHYMINAW